MTSCYFTQQGMPKETPVLEKDIHDEKHQQDEREKEKDKEQSKTDEKVQRIGFSF